MGEPSDGAPFDSAWWKWAWATRHAVALQVEVVQLTQDEAVGPRIVVGTVYEADHQRFALVVSEVELLPPETALRLGDVVHNYRSTLDHIAWAMVGRGTDPSARISRPKSINFPILDDSAKFAPRSALPGVAGTDLAMVEGLQPYQAGESERLRHVLRICADLDNEDKHQQFRELLLYPSGIQWEVAEASGCEVIEPVRSTRSAEAFYVGMNLGYVQVVPTTADPKLEVDVTVELNISVTPGVTLDEWLTRASRLIHDLLVTLQPERPAGVVRLLNHDGSPSPPA